MAPATPNDHDQRDPAGLTNRDFQMSLLLLYSRNWLTECSMNRRYTDNRISSYTTVLCGTVKNTFKKYAPLSLKFQPTARS